MEYLGLWVTRNGIRPVNKKVKARVKYDTTKKPKIGACVHRLSALQQGYVDQTVTFNISFNCAYVK